MDDNQGQEIRRSSEPPSPRLPRSYNLLIQLSRNMGTVATKSSIINDVRSFMSKEISISPSERVFRNTIPKLTLSDPGSTSQNQSDQDRAEDKKQREVQEEKESAVEKQKALQKVVSQSHEVLMSSNTVFPISLFPDTITIDRTKITITKRDFFWSSDVMSIRIEDVLNVQVTVGPLFGALNIASRVMSTTDHFRVSHLWRSDSIRLKQMIQGYVIAQHNKIDTSHLKKSDLIETLLELGHDSN